MADGAIAESAAGACVGVGQSCAICTDAIAGVGIVAAGGIGGGTESTTFGSTAVGSIPSGVGSATSLALPSSEAQDASNTTIATA